MLLGSAFSPKGVFTFTIPFSTAYDAVSEWPLNSTVICCQTVSVWLATATLRSSNKKTRFHSRSAGRPLRLASAAMQNPLCVSIRLRTPREDQVVPEGAVRLFGEEMIPVCSRALLLDKTRPLKRPQNLAHHTLLHFDYAGAETMYIDWGTVRRLSWHGRRLLPDALGQFEIRHSARWLSRQCHRRPVKRWSIRPCWVIEPLTPSMSRECSLPTAKNIHLPTMSAVCP
jgi:hypothetical protein